MHKHKFSAFQGIKHVCIAIGGDYGKYSFNMLMTICIESYTYADLLHFDEIISKIDISKDEVEVLRPLVNYLRKVFSLHSMLHKTVSTTVQILIHKETKVKTLVC